MTRALEPVSERLRLRQWQDDDYGPFAAMGLDEHVMEFFPALLTPQASNDLATRMRQRIEERGWGFWAAELRATGEFLGFIGIEEPDSPLPFQPCVEIGWRLAHEHWGKGYATEGARAALRAGFETLVLDEIVSYAVLANRRSRHVMEKLGMRDAAFTFDHPRIREGSPLRAHCLYRLTRKEWTEAGQALGR
jgi:RimJ/RimL family protein N-acetyltransferase